MPCATIHVNATAATQTYTVACWPKSKGFHLVVWAEGKEPREEVELSLCSVSLRGQQGLVFSRKSKKIYIDLIETNFVYNVRTTRPNRFPSVT